VENPYLKGLESSSIKGSFGQLIQLKEKYPGIQTIISVGGWSGSGEFSNVALTNESRMKFADSVVQFLRNYQFDGVDLDWEYPVAGGLDTNVTRPEDKENYTLLLQTIREKLNQAGQKDHTKYLLTIAGGANNSFVNNTELNKIDKIVDWINIMTYDFHGAWENVTGNNAPLYSSNGSGLDVNDAVQAYLDAGVRAKHIVLGVPFYGKGWDGVSSVKNGEFQQAAGPSQAGTWEPATFDYTDLENNYIDKNGFISYWDDVEKEPYLYNPTTGTFITYENVRSIQAKADYINDKHLGGAMLWEISGDRNETLLSSLAKAVLK
jgi:chitinase